MAKRWVCLEHKWNCSDDTVDTARIRTVLSSIQPTKRRGDAHRQSSKARNTYPLVKLHRPKAIETKTTAEEHVEAPDSSRINKLDTPMAKDWGWTQNADNTQSGSCSFSDERQRLIGQNKTKSMGKRKSQQHEDNSGLNIRRSKATHGRRCERRNSSPEFCARGEFFVRLVVACLNITPRHIPAWASSRMTHCGLCNRGDETNCEHSPVSCRQRLAKRLKVTTWLRTFVNEEIGNVTATDCQGYRRQPWYYVVHPSLQEQTGLATNTSRFRMNVAVLWKYRGQLVRGRGRRGSSSSAEPCRLRRELPWNVEMSPWSMSAARTTGCKMSPLSTGVQTSWTLNDGGEAEEEGGIWTALKSGNARLWDEERKDPRAVPDWGLRQKSQQERSGQNGEWPRTCHLFWGKVTWKTHQSLRDI